MKKVILIAAMAFSLNVFAQPIITDGTNIPAPGLSAPVTYGTAITGVGSPGANQTWDFSTVSFTALGTLTTIDPATSAFATSFPTANYSYSLAGTSSYFYASATQMEVFAYSITSPGSGNDYSPNPRTLLKFPFNYNDTQTDTWQKSGGSANNVTITYDGYGTLITPTSTYSNVVRIKEDYGNGEVDYQWYILNPLMSILAYNNGSNTFYHTGYTEPTGITAKNNLDISIDVYPNPAKDKLALQLSGFPSQGDLKLNLINVFGQVVKQVPINSTFTTIELDNIANGIYIYQLNDKYIPLKTGKIIIE